VVNSGCDQTNADYLSPLIGLDSYQHIGIWHHFNPYMEVCAKPTKCVQDLKHGRFGCKAASGMRHVVAIYPLPERPYLPPRSDDGEINVAMGIFAAYRY
jgi:hypothetical protein